MSQFCIHISDEQHRHQWGYSPTVGTYTCMKCSERRNYNDPQYAEAEREYQAQVRNMQQSSDMVERVARRLAQRHIRFAQAPVTHAQIDAQWHFYKGDAETALEASHHAELVGALRRLVEWLAPSGCRQRVLGEADAVLRKVDPDYDLLDKSKSHYSSVQLEEIGRAKIGGDA